MKSLIVTLCLIASSICSAYGGKWITNTVPWDSSLYPNIKESITINDFPEVDDQGPMTFCSTFSGAAILDYFNCKENGTANCALLPKTERLSAIALVDYANGFTLIRDNYNTGNLDISSGHSKLFWNVFMHKPTVPTQACLSEDNLGNKLGMGKTKFANGTEQMLSHGPVLDKAISAFEHKDESTFPYSQFEKAFGYAISKEEVVAAMKAPTFETFLFQVIVEPAKSHCQHSIDMETKIKRPDTREYLGEFGEYSQEEIKDPSKRSARNYAEGIAKIKELLKMGIPIQASVQMYLKRGADFKALAGHGVALDGYRLACNKNTCREFVRLKNSWGKKWQDDHSDGWVDAQILFNNLVYFEWVYPTDKAPLTEEGKISKTAWTEWQASMQRAYEALQKKTQKNELRPTDIDQFFAVYAADNPWSNDARLLREKARKLMTSDGYSKQGSTSELFPTFKDCDKCPSMTILPQGGFVMGGVDEGGQIAPRKKPQHFVEIKRFALSTTPITYDEWDACVDDHGCNNYKPEDGGKGRGKRPVDSISRYDAEAYVNWLNTKAKGAVAYRLPTTAEWEYAQRGGTSTPYYAGNSIADLEPYEIFKTAEQLQLPKKQRRKGAAPVASKKPNPFGLYDMAGNIRGWTADCFDEKTGNTDYTYSHFNSSTKFPLSCTGKGVHTYNIIRGGFWGSIDDTQSASYDFLESKERFSEIGFRVAKSIGD